MTTARLFVLPILFVSCQPPRAIDMKLHPLPGWGERERGVSLSGVPPLVAKGNIKDDKKKNSLAVVLHSIPIH
jgi:hypothetical protein